MTIMPEGEALRKAVQWISDERQEDPLKKMALIIEAACLKFNLTPIEALYLEKWVRSEEKAG
jgi:hypothetical protein